MMRLVVLLSLLLHAGSAPLQSDPAALKARLLGTLPTSKNGRGASPSLRQTIDGFARDLERRNPTHRPAESAKMNGFWRMLCTSLEGAPSAGQLGPLTGDVFQDLDSSQSSPRSRMNA